MKKSHKELFSLITSLKDQKEVTDFLKDLLTPQEIELLSERWMIVKLLNQGLTQREIAKKLGVSISTVTRGSRTLKYGSGAFKRLLNKT